MTKRVTLTGAPRSSRCTVEGCSRNRHSSRLYCSMHGERLRLRGAVGGPMPKCDSPNEPILKRLMRRRSLNPRTGCWEWSGHTVGGYGHISIRQRHHMVHRLAAQLFLGFDPRSGLHVLHTCDNPPCFNPQHLYLGTHQDNMADCVTRNRLRPPRGSAHKRAKLSEKDIVDIRSLAKTPIRRIDLAKQFGISRASLFRIIKRQSWTHV